MRCAATLKPWDQLQGDEPTDQDDGCADDCEYDGRRHDTFTSSGDRPRLWDFSGPPRSCLSLLYGPLRLGVEWKPLPQELGARRRGCFGAGDRRHAADHKDGGRPNSDDDGERDGPHGHFSTLTSAAVLPHFAYKLLYELRFFDS